MKLDGIWHEYCSMCDTLKYFSSMGAETLIVSSKYSSPQVFKSLNEDHLLDPFLCKNIPSKH